MVEKGENMLTTLLYGFDMTKFVGNTLYFILSLIALDILTGLLASAKERKLSSKINFNGMIKKVSELIVLVFVSLIDAYFKANGNVVKLGVSIIIGYEGMSIVENLDRIGWNLKFVTKYFNNGKDENK
jgi:toxin secretion/phage lysis holin